MVNELRTLALLFALAPRPLQGRSFEEHAVQRHELRIRALSVNSTECRALALAQLQLEAHQPVSLLRYDFHHLIERHDRAPERQYMHSAQYGDALLLSVDFY